MDRDSRTRLFIDIGTNCEIVLGNREWLTGTAAPAGPAFEGAAIRCGMRAADGAIEGVTITPGGVSLKVIGDAEPAGLCGSGLVDAVAGLVGAGLLDSSGRFMPEGGAAGRGGGPRGPCGPGGGGRGGGAGGGGGGRGAPRPAPTSRPASSSSWPSPPGESAAAPRAEPAAAQAAVAVIACGALGGHVR